MKEETPVQSIGTFDQSPNSRVSRRVVPSNIISRKFSKESRPQDKGETGDMEFVPNRNRLFSSNAIPDVSSFEVRKRKTIPFTAVIRERMDRLSLNEASKFNHLMVETRGK